LEYKLLRTEDFLEWLGHLRDAKARARIQARVDRFAIGNPGDVKFVGEAVWEMRIDYGPGYRVYFSRRRERVIILLAGGDKRSQKKDIARAIELAKLYGS
jgi:putative addiction module killer protein